MKSKHPKYPFEMACTLTKCYCKRTENHMTLVTAKSFRKYNELHLLQSLTLAAKYNSQTQLGFGGSLRLKLSVVT